MRRCLLLATILFPLSAVIVQAQEVPVDGPIGYGNGGPAGDYGAGYCNGGACGNYGCDNGTCGGNCCCNCCPCDCCAPTWVVRGGAIFLHRNSPSTANIGFVIPQDAAALNLGYSTGYEVSAIRNFNCCFSVEARYFQVDNWNAGFANANPLVPNPIDPVLLPPLAVAEGGNLSSLLRSAEINFRRQMNCWLTGLVGFRYLNLSERFDFGNRTVSTDQAAFPLDTSTLINANTHNDLYGGQLGADGCIWCRNGMKLDGFGKAGIYGNAASANATAAIIDNTGLNPPIVNAGNVQNNQVAFVGELGLIGSYCLTDHITLRGGYQMMWVNGVALVTEQVGGAFVTTGHVFYHGALAGAEFKW